MKPQFYLLFLWTLPLAVRQPTLSKSCHNSSFVLLSKLRQYTDILVMLGIHFCTNTDIVSADLYWYIVYRNQYEPNILKMYAILSVLHSYHYTSLIDKKHAQCFFLQCYVNSFSPVSKNRTDIHTVSVLLQPPFFLHKLIHLMLSLFNSVNAVNKVPTLNLPWYL